MRDKTAIYLSLGFVGLVALGLWWFRFYFNPFAPDPLTVQSRFQERLHTFSPSWGHVRWEKCDTQGRNYTLEVPYNEQGLPVRVRLTWDMGHRVDPWVTIMPADPNAISSLCDFQYIDEQLVLLPPSKVSTARREKFRSLAGEVLSALQEAQ